jgi:hypothetical protein
MLSLKPWLPWPCVLLTDGCHLQLRAHKEGTQKIISES